MPISHKYKAIFVHIPKTAGTSIEHSLEIIINSKKLINKPALRSHETFNIENIKYAPQHFTSKILREHEQVKEHWNSYFKFSIIRHPYDRVLSEFFWLNKGMKTFDPVKFNKFLNNYYEKIDTDHKLSQYDYLVEDGNVLVDYVGRFEKLGEAFKFLKKKLNLQTSLPKIQRSHNKPDYVNSLSQVQKIKIYNIYKNDFEFFGYKK